MQRERNSLSLSASLSLFSPLTLFSHAHLWSLKLSLKMRVSSNELFSTLKKEGASGVKKNKLTKKKSTNLFNEINLNRL